MTVAQLIEKLGALPREAVVLIENGGGLSRVAEMEFVPGGGPGAPDEIILLPYTDE